MRWHTRKRGAVFGPDGVAEPTGYGGSSAPRGSPETKTFGLGQTLVVALAANNKQQKKGGRLFGAMPTRE